MLAASDRVVSDAVATRPELPDAVLCCPVCILTINAFTHYRRQIPSLIGVQSQIFSSDIKQHKAHAAELYRLGIS